MGKARIKISAKSGKSGTKLASVPITVTRNDNQHGKPFYKPQVQMTVSVTTNGKGQRRKSS